MFEQGSILGTYRIVRLLGEGGMGAVYEVEHLQLGVHYALKTFTLNDGNRDLFVRRFAVEGKMLARLKHPNLTSVFDLQQDEQSGTLYYVMDLVLYKDGEAHTLADLEPGGADEDQISDWFCQMCDALAYVHAQGIVHRDIKLNNILIAPDHHLVLSDFGISRVCDDRLRQALDASRTMSSATNGKLIVGTHGYMAPEVLRGETATPAADIYALGVVFFKLLTGVWYDPDLEPGNDRQTAGSTNAHKLLADFERPWKDVLPAMLAKHPSKRPTNLAELPKRLFGEETTRKGDAASTPHQNKGTATIFRSRLFIAALVTILLSALAAVLFFLKHVPAASDDSLVDEAFAIPDSVK